ncbi:MAG: GntR family transcriptional regulator [Hyphomicrobium sp.]|uniref:GntR family transcriptional regulator n=1 Tax=Hyphomicrobium sp. TaxID=82 RepID=UPI0039E6B2B0
MPKKREPFRLPQADGERETQASKAYHAVRAMILRCELQPGSVINDRYLIEKLGYGRTPLREALLRLAGERLVLFQRNQVIEVAPVEVSEVNDLYTLRLHLERLAWRLWLEAATSKQVSRLAHTFDVVPALAREGDVEGLLLLDFEFHSQVYQECGNPLLTQALYNLSGLTYRLWYMTNTNDVKAQAATARSHGPIIDAIRRRDARALDTEIARHISEAYDAIMDKFRVNTVSRIGQIPIQLLTKEEGNGLRDA